MILTQSVSPCINVFRTNELGVRTRIFRHRVEKGGGEGGGETDRHRGRGGRERGHRCSVDDDDDDD